jgi:hypothetical protein
LEIRPLEYDLGEIDDRLNDVVLVRDIAREVKSDSVNTSTAVTTRWNFHELGYTSDLHLSLAGKLELP